MTAAIVTAASLLRSRRAQRRPAARCSGRRANRWPLFLLIGLLLLKSAMPWLASVAAQSQGRDLVEICTEHGVRLMAAENAAKPPPAAQQLPSATNDHCPLNGLSALASSPSAEIGPIP